MIHLEQRARRSAEWLRGAGNRPPRTRIEGPTRQIRCHRSELGKVQCGGLRRKVIVGSRSRALPSMKTSPCKSPTVVASRTLSGTQAGLPRRAGSVRARERRWRSHRCGGGHTTARRPLDDIPPFPGTMACRPDPGGYVVRDANGQALAYLYSRDNEDEAGRRRHSRKTRRDGRPSTSPGFRSYSGRRIATRNEARNIGTRPPL
jgi:hypothetical protein